LESSCAGVANPLADELRRRSYGARILQTGPLLEVKLSGAPFLYSGFYGYVTKAGATFVMYNDPYDFAAITEDLPDSSLLLIYGTATTTDSSTGLFGRFEGSFERLSGPPPMTAGKCPATSFSLVPK
jgi:hypothetical protein